jgi:hypothetical protein
MEPEGGREKERERERERGWKETEVGRGGIEGDGN